jgi:hypothetical protein
VAQPLRGTQSLVGQMGWVFARPSLTALEVAWRWLFGVPFLFVCWMQSQKILAALPPESAGLSLSRSAESLGGRGAAQQRLGALSASRAAVLRWLLPVAALAWVVVSGLGRSLLLKRMEPRCAFRPFG